METPILDMLKSLNLGTRFSMPGHKGRLELLGSRIAKFDITELSGTDNLYAPNGVIEKSQELYSEEVGAEHSFFSVNGSSAGVIASILSCVSEGESIIVARDFHLSVENALKLSGAKPIYVELESSIGQVPPAVNADDVCTAIKNNPWAKAVFVTYPNYYGLCTNLQRIARMAHRYKMKLIVDAAHAAHFPYSSYLPQSPADAGADIWVSSLHKTLPALNQCAVVCTADSVDAARVKECLNMVQTTSPSYLLLASIDYARAMMAEKGAEYIAAMKAKNDTIKNRINEIDGIEVIPTDDFTRMVIDVSGRGITGFRAEAALMQKGIGIECADERNIVLILTVMDMAGDFEALIYALRTLPLGVKNFTDEIQVLRSGMTYSPREANFKPRYYVPVIEAEGKIAAKSVFAYPPGVPLVVAGQEITEEIIELIIKYNKKGYNLVGYNNKLCVVDE